MISMRAESLYFATLEGNWDDVVAEYQNNPKIHKRPINITNDTALHVAVNDGRADVVTKVVNELKKSPKSLSALEIGNEKETRISVDLIWISTLATHSPKRS